MTLRTDPRLPPALRQQRLLARSTMLRAALARDLQALEGPARWADQGLAGWRWLRAHPEWPLAGVALVALLRPRRAWRWSLRLWWGWRQGRRLRRWLAAASR